MSRLTVHFAGMLVLIVGTLSAVAAADNGMLDRIVTVEIDAQPLATALIQFSKQAGVQVITPAQKINNLATAGVHGKMSVYVALSKLLQGTTLSFHAAGANTIGLDEPTAVKSQDDELDFVIVSATRRREAVLEVPMQVTALRSGTLERAGAKTLADYLADQPGIDLSSSGYPGGELSIRGVSTGYQSIATVGVYVDDVATGSSSAYANGRDTSLDMGLLDLNRIEILRGPQGTLYGAGSMGGLLKYVTNQPDPTGFSGTARVEGSSIRDGGISSTLNAVVNIPIKEDVAAVRFAAFHDHFGGYYDAVGPAADTKVDRGNTDGARISLLLKPKRELTVRLTATVQDARRAGLALEDMDPTTGQPVEGDLTRFLYVKESYHGREQLYGLDVEYDFGWARLNAITSLQYMKLTLAQDISPGLIPTLISSGLSAESVLGAGGTTQSRQSQEFRLTSRSDPNIEWLAGLYWNHESGSVDGRYDAALGDGAGSLNLVKRSQPSTYQESAGYGDVTWHATPALALTGGARIARNRQHYSNTLSGELSLGTPEGGSSAETSATYLATAAYAIAPTSNVYFRAASGYRAGGVNGLALRTPNPYVHPTFQSDSLWSYELGYKAELLERALSVETAVYDVEWRNLQQSLSTPDGQLFYINAGDARVRGIELALTWAPSREWRFNLTATTIDGHLLNDAPGLGAGMGAQLADSARFSAAVSVTRNLKVGGHDAYLGMNAHHVGERNSGYSGSFTLPNFVMPAFTQVDLQAGIDFRHFNLSGYVRNLTNERGIVSASFQVDSVAQVTVTQPLTIGLGVTVPF